MAKFPVSLKARLILEDAGKFLFLRQTKKNGGRYSLVGGTIEREEYAAQTLIRESREEAGILITPNDLSLVHVLHKRYKREHRIVLYFKAFAYEGTPESRETEKFRNVAWLPLNDLPAEVSPTVRHAIEEGLNKGLIYSEMEK